MEKKRLFYGWVIVAAGMLILALGLGMFSSTNSVFVVPVCEDLGLSRTAFTFHRTIITLVSCAVTPFYGKLVQRMGVRRMLIIGSTALSLVTFCYSLAASVAHFYILAFINGVFFNAVSFMVIGILIGNWFADSKGLATGIAYAGSGIGGAVMIPVISGVVERFDWRMGYRVMGVVGFILLLGLTLLFVRNLPSDRGLRPYVSGRKKTAAEEPEVFDLSLREVLRTGRFWLLAAAFALIACFASATNTHSKPFLDDLGYAPETVSAVISLFMMFLTLGKIILGQLYDRAGRLVSAVFIGLCCMVFPVAALLSGGMPFPWIYAVAVGTASCALSTPMPILVAKYFGAREYPTVFSILTTVTALGSSVSVPTMGAVYDATGHYDLAWYVLLGLSCVIALCLVGAELNYRRRVKQSHMDIRTRS